MRSSIGCIRRTPTRLRRCTPKVAAGTCGKGYSSHYLVFATFKIDGVAPLRRPASGGFGFL